VRLSSSYPPTVLSPPRLTRFLPLDVVSSSDARSSPSPDLRRSASGWRRISESTKPLTVSFASPSLSYSHSPIDVLYAMQIRKRTSRSSSNSTLVTSFVPKPSLPCRSRSARRRSVRLTLSLALPLLPCIDSLQDVYYDNVGGSILNLALTRLNKHARIVLCGAIEDVSPSPIPRPLS
jgi:hypothetical protein